MPAQPAVTARALLALLRTVRALPRPVKRALAGPPTRIDGQTLDLDVQWLLRLLALAPAPPKSSITVEQARNNTRRSATILAGLAPTMSRLEHVDIPGPVGRLGARLFVPEGVERPGPLLVYFHGGGWVSGDLDSHDGACRLLAAEAGVLVLSVDYRRAPDHRFPAAVDDALAAFEWAVDNASALGADPDRIGVGGDSAGGNLAAVVSRLARDRGAPPPAMQLLLYPVIDLSIRHPSRWKFGEGFFLTDDDMDWYRGHYLPVDDDATARDPRVSPLLADDLAGLPPAYIATAGFDPLRDEGEAYAEALWAAGVATTLRRHPGLIHGFANMAAVVPAARDATLEAAGTLAMGLAGRQDSPRLR